MNHWLFKSEPHEYSIDNLAAEPKRIGRWDGIRNYMARNFLRDNVAVGDPVLFYQSNCKTPGVVGIAKVVKAAYPDPAQFNPDSRYHDPKATAENPRWVCVDIQFVEKLPRLVSLTEMKQMPQLADMALLKYGRLSIQPVAPHEWQTILSMAKTV